MRKNRVDSSFAKSIVSASVESSNVLSSSIAFFEHLALTARAAEARVELARCYFRQGLFDIAREALGLVLAALPPEETELRSFALVLLAAVERDAGCLDDSLRTLKEVKPDYSSGELVTGRYHHEMATTLKELANSSPGDTSAALARRSFTEALDEFESIGNHRNVAAAKNNLGYLLLNLGEFADSERCLKGALNLFHSFHDHVRVAQVSETLAKLYLMTGQYDLAFALIEKAVTTLESSDGEALLTEALTTKAIIVGRLGGSEDAKRIFEGAYRVAERCGDSEGMARALVTLLEEITSHLTETEVTETIGRLKVLVLPYQSPLNNRVQAIGNRFPNSWDLPN